MVCARIELATNFRGMFEIRTGDLAGSTTCSNLSRAEVLEEVGLILDGLVVADKAEKESEERPIG